MQVAQHGVVDRLVDAGVAGFRDPDLRVGRRGGVDGGEHRDHAGGRVADAAGDPELEQRGVMRRGDLAGEPGVERRLDLGDAPGGLDPAQHVADRGPVGPVSDPQAGAVEEDVFDGVPGEVPADHLFGLTGRPDVLGAVR